MYLPDLASIQRFEPRHTHTSLVLRLKCQPFEPRGKHSPTLPHSPLAFIYTERTQTCSHAFPVGCLLAPAFTERFTVSQALRCFPRTDVEIVQETQFRCFQNTLWQSVFLSNYHRFVDKLGEREAGSNLLLCVMHLAAMLTM